MPEAPVFVMGPRRSGTTLVSLLLDGHPRLAIYHESYFYPVFAPRRRRYGDLTRLENTVHLIEDVRAFLRTQRVAMRPELEDFLDVLPSPSFEGVFAALLALYAQSEGKARGGDKTPGHHRYLDEIAKDFPASPIVFVVRDPLDTILSIREGFGASLEGAAWSWISAVRHYLDAPRAVHLIRYEDLVADPQGVIAEACRFLGEVYDPAMLYHVPRVGRSLPDVPRIHRRLLDPVDAASVGRFQRMPPAEIAWIEGACAQGMAALGYEPVSGSVRRVVVSPPSRWRKAREKLAYYRSDRSRWKRGWLQWRTILGIRLRGLARHRPWWGHYK